MSILAIIVFSFCAWAVFSHRFKDGIVAKHFLSLSAIMSFLVIVDQHNYAAAATALILLILGVGYACYKYNMRVIRPSHRHRPF